jgi:hypothetical protein
MQSYGIEGDVVRAAAIALLPYPTIPVGAINKFMRNFGIPAVTCVRVRAEIIKVGVHVERAVEAAKTTGYAITTTNAHASLCSSSWGRRLQWQRVFRSAKQYSKVPRP